MLCRVILCAALALCCCACAGEGLPLGGPEAADRLLDPFESDFSLQYGSVNAEGHFTRTGPGCGLLEFTAPETVEGLVVECDGGAVTLSYLGLQAQFAADSLPAGAARELVAVLDALARQPERTPTVEEETAIFGGDTGQSAFALTVDRQSGAFLELTAGEPAFTVKFENFVFSS